ncbi:hypothetical protein Pcac1_g1168 [Phytophthora cactorum]|nr:hypothetical protein Pcac1_g1168 [Phytophthora cactorum]
MQPLAPMPTEAALFEEAAAFLDMNTQTPFDSVQVFNTGKFPSSESIELLSAIDSPVSHSFRDEVDVENGPQSDKLRRQKEALRRQKQRQRRKDERESLQREGIELALQLQRLKQAIESNAGTNRASVQLSNYYWRDCATKQRDERLAAEAEQKRLVAATNVQATYIDNLTKLLERRASTSLQESWAPGIRDSKRLRVETSDDAVFTALHKEVDDDYARVDELLRECCMDELSMGIRNSVRRNEESGEVEYLEHVNKCIQPFDYETTYTSVWKVAGHPHRQLDREVFAGAAGQENTIAVKFRLERTLTTGTKVSIKQWLVVRRFIEEDRVFHGWKIYSEGEGILRGIYSDETGWIRVRPTSDRFGTWTEAIVRQVPVLFSTCTSKPGGSVVGVFRRMLQDKIDEDEKRLRGAMEGLMIEDTLTIVDEYLTFTEGEGIFSGMDAEETLWSSIRPYADGLTDGDVMRFCLRQLPVPFLATHTRGSTLKEVQGMLKDVTKEDELELTTSLQRLALRDSSGGTKAQERRTQLAPSNVA